MAAAQSGGYEFKVKGKLPTTCQCLICQELIRECTELPCHHPYCKSCLLRWEDQKLEENERLGRNHVLRCLLCNQEYKVQDKHYSGAIDRIVTEDLEVLCKHNEQGCPWTGAINDFMQHANADCSYVEITCRFTGCDVRFLRKAKQQHEQNCPMKEVNCDYCHQVIKVSRAQEHYGECGFHPTICGNTGCQQKCPKNQSAHHQLTDCLYQNITCSFDDVGCKVKVLRKDLLDHEAAANVSHTKLLLQKHLQTNTELAKTKQDLVETKKTLKVTNDELYATKEQLNITNNELLDAKTKLQNVETKLRESNDKIEELKKNYLPPKETQKAAKTLASQKHKPIISSHPEPLAKLKFQKDDQEINSLFSSSQSIPNYARRLENFSLKMEKGKLYFHQKNIFFKLSQFCNNGRDFYVIHVTNINEFRGHPYTVFSNDNLVLVDDRFAYNLYMQITNFNRENSELFLVSRRNQQEPQRCG
ncbi:TNF receptor-associated factor 3-like [Clytia hemisphaerica]|uniref:TNF receptor-associated factor 3-like n=1 Tax=Clytia hemisphaerica TaxID=252671 RepID=UPI0034D599D6